MLIPPLTLPFRMADEEMAVLLQEAISELQESRKQTSALLKQNQQLMEQNNRLSEGIKEAVKNNTLRNQQKPKIHVSVHTKVCCAPPPPPTTHTNYP